MVATFLRVFSPIAPKLHRFCYVHFTHKAFYILLNSGNQKSICEKGVFRWGCGSAYKCIVLWTVLEPWNSPCVREETVFWFDVSVRCWYSWNDTVLWFPFQIIYCCIDYWLLREVGLRRYLSFSKSSTAGILTCSLIGQYYEIYICCTNYLRRLKMLHHKFEYIYTVFLSPFLIQIRLPCNCYYCKTFNLSLTYTYNV